MNGFFPLSELVPPFRSTSPMGSSGSCPPRRQLELFGSLVLVFGDASRGSCVSTCKIFNFSVVFHFRLCVCDVWTWGWRFVTWCLPGRQFVSFIRKWFYFLPPNSFLSRALLFFFWIWLFVFFFFLIAYASPCFSAFRLPRACCGRLLCLLFSHFVSPRSGPFVREFGSSLLILPPVKLFWGGHWHALHCLPHQATS